MNSNILITSAGRRVSLVRSFQSTVKTISLGIKIYTGDLNPKWSAACHISDGFFTLPRVEDNSYSQTLLQICITNNIGLIVPTIDTELIILSKLRDKFANFGVKIAISDIDFIEKCRDKRKTSILFKELDIDIPSPIDKLKPYFPLFIKPYDGSLSKDTLIVNNISELNKSLLENEKLLFMEYLSPDEYQEFTVDAYFNLNGELKCLVPRRRIEVRGGEISKGKTERSDLYYSLINKFQNIKGARACLTMQFFQHRKTNVIKGIEINPRFGGGFPLTFESGANYPYFLMNEYIFNQQLDFFDNWKANKVMLRFDSEILFDESPII